MSYQFIEDVRETWTKYDWKGNHIDKQGRTYKSWDHLLGKTAFIVKTWKTAFFIFMSMRDIRLHRQSQVERSDVEWASCMNMITWNNRTH